VRRSAVKIIVAVFLSGLSRGGGLANSPKFSSIYTYGKILQ
jgi:hypothetical protein